MASDTTCHFCGESPPTLANSLVTIDGKVRLLTGLNQKLHLVGSDKLWSYIYHENLRESHQGSVEPLNFPKITFTFFVGESFPGNNGIDSKHVQLCDRCFIEFEQLENYHKGLESLKLMINQKMKVINGLRKNRKLENLWKTPSYLMSFSGGAAGKENVAKTLRFLDSLSEQVMESRPRKVGQEVQNGILPSALSAAQTMIQLTEPRTNGITSNGSVFVSQSSPIITSTSILPPPQQAPPPQPQQQTKYVMVPGRMNDGQIVLIPVAQPPPPRTNCQSPQIQIQTVPQSPQVQIQAAPPPPPPPLVQAPQVLVSQQMQVQQAPTIINGHGHPPPPPPPLLQEIKQDEPPEQINAIENIESFKTEDEDSNSQEMIMETDEQFPVGEDGEEYFEDDSEESSDLVISNVRSAGGDEATPSTSEDPKAKRRRLRYVRVNCSTCGKSVTSHNLPAHMRVHTGEKPYHCNICDNDFRYNSSFYRHLREVHEVNDGVHQRDKFLYKCPVCGRICRSSDKLEDHMKEVHGEQSEESAEREEQQQQENQQLNEQTNL